MGSSLLRRAVPEAITNLLVSCLDENPDLRPQNAEEVCRRLQSLSTGHHLRREGGAQYRGQGRLADSLETSSRTVTQYSRALESSAKVEDAQSETAAIACTLGSPRSGGGRRAGTRFCQRSRGLWSDAGDSFRGRQRSDACNSPGRRHSCARADGARRRGVIGEGICADGGGRAGLPRGCAEGVERGVYRRRPSSRMELSTFHRTASGSCFGRIARCRSRRTFQRRSWLT